MVKPRRQSIKRAAQIARMGAGILGNHLAFQLQRPFLDAERASEERRSLKYKNAKHLRQHLQNLRGPVMKLGQALSMQTRWLDEETVRELSGLQMQAPPMHPTLMRAQFRNAFGKYPEEVFHSFEAEPFAAASLGQVHYAVTRRGEEVAVKIQYPAIRDAIETDFRMLRAAGLPARLTGHLQEGVIREAERGIIEETDYSREARNIEHFRKQLAPLPFIHLPKVYPELSCDQVLTMSRVTGLRLQEFLQTNPSQRLRDTVGANLARLFFFQLFRVQALHADPHPGNYFFRSDGAIGLVDFGCVKYLKPEVVRCYAQFWSRQWLHDPALYADIVGVIFDHESGRPGPRVRRCMEEIGRFYTEFHPLIDPPPVLDLGDPKFMDALGRLAKTLLTNKIIAPEFLFLSRTESGMCNLLHSLKARMATTAIAKEWMPAMSQLKPSPLPAVRPPP